MSVAPAETHLYTVGHSTRSLDQLVDLLKDFGIAQLVDVRHYPRSRRNPQFNFEALERELPPRGIAYIWDEGLGGFRKGGYLLHMTTPEFAQGIERLEALMNRRPTVIMCAEIVWFRCHRRYIARQMVTRGYGVTNIVTRGKPGYDEPLPAGTQPT